MPTSESNQKYQIEAALKDFADQPLADAARGLFAALGYASNRHLPIASVETFRSLLDPGGSLTEANALLSRWENVHFLFQLTPEDLTTSSMRQGLLLQEDKLFDNKIVKSYVFFAIKLAGSTPTRTDLSLITRAVNRLLPMPILVLFKHESSLSLAIINRRKNLRDGTRDVLTRVSLIRDIDTATPHRAHLDLLNRFSLPMLAIESGSIKTFADLDNAWQMLLSVQELNRRFYRELVDWFTWAISEIKLAKLPDHTPDDDMHRARATQEFAVRLICRTLFAWFVKEMRLIPPQLLELYDAADRQRWLPGGTYNADGNHYYRGILQNVFFQALNRPMDQRRKTGPEAASDRTVTKPELKKFAYLGKHLLPEAFEYDLFDRIPYLNGGLFDALPEDNASDTIDDGALRIPNKLFYARREDGFTLASGTGRRRSARPMEGLNRIFDRYRFTIAENTPLEEDVALDPELLGLVFENLLAEIDPDDAAAAESARKASGSYYTPRRIVDYMVNEALHLHLRTVFERQGASSDDLRLLGNLCYEMPDGTDFSPIAERVVAALDAVRVLDPACGSGAYPMGMLHRMVDLLARVDPDNERWIQRLLARLPAPMRADARAGMAGKSYNYLRKLGLIQKNLFGLDIQPLAALIAKLRFFLTLVIEQEIAPADRAHNYGLQSLPNLETNLLCANSLNDAEHGLLSGPLLANLRAAREEYYQPQTTRTRRDEIAAQIGHELAALYPDFAEKAKGLYAPPVDLARGFTAADRDALRREQAAGWLAEWFKHATVAAPFFNVETFYPELVGEGAGRQAAPFHIVIGNPPYGGTKIPDDIKEALGLGSKDPYGAFIARFLGDTNRPPPLANGGVLAYIVSDTFMTIKSHRPLREQMMRNRIHKMLRVSGDTFKATVNCAVILCQRGEPPEDQICQMADLTNVSIHDQYERFLHLLYQTEGFARRQNVSNQTYAIYHYRQSLIKTNSNLPFFVASPKLFALMNDKGNLRSAIIRESKCTARTVCLNGQQKQIVEFSEVAASPHGISTGDNKKYVRVLEGTKGNYEIIEPWMLVTTDELQNLSAAEKVNGLNKDWKSLAGCFVPFEKGGESDAREGWMPNYRVPTQYYVNWAKGAIADMRTNSGFAWKNERYYFLKGLTFSISGIYAPTFRLNSGGVFEAKGSGIFCDVYDENELLGMLCSKMVRYLLKNYIKHSVDTSGDDIAAIPFVTEFDENISRLAAQIVRKQKEDPRYDYASNEQLEIDRLVYDAYGLNEADIREVEDWYTRRYPALASAQKRNLATKQGKSEEQLMNRSVVHLYCDESRHLPHDRASCLLMGLVSCPVETARGLNHELAELWKAHGLPLHFEAKWTKVSPARLDFYRDLLNWFFVHDGLAFRALVLPDKSRLYAKLPEGSRDYLYYRLYYQLLRDAIEPECRYRAFLDIKDTRGRDKLAQLRQLLAADADDAAALQTLQHIRSHEVRLAQIADLLLGAVGFARAAARETGQPQPSPAKQALVRQIESILGHPLTSDSPPGATKTRISTWHDPDALLL